MLGKGFLFEARQKRFTFEEKHFYVDLVFYNRLLQNSRRQVSECEVWPIIGDPP